MKLGIPLLSRFLSSLLWLWLSFLFLPVANADDFAKVVPGRQFSFPQDHNPHSYVQSEWWYVTANLQGEDGVSYGAQFTLFSNTLIIDKQPQQVFFAHAALSTPNHFYHAERYARADMGHAGTRPEPWQLFIDHWQFNGTGKQPLPGVLSVNEGQFAYRLKLSASPYFLQGDKGFSKKNSSGSLASYYYNAPFIKIDGTIALADKTIKVQGDAWFDREWSSGIFAGKAINNTTNNTANNTAQSKPIIDNIGWDWLSLHLDKHHALMLYRVRSKDEIWLSGTMMSANGEQKALSADDIDWQPNQWQTFKGKKYPIGWQLKVPSQQVDISISPINNNQFLDATIPYWEGAVKTQGSHTAKGYLELFGY